MYSTSKFVKVVEIASNLLVGNQKAEVLSVMTALGLQSRGTLRLNLDDRTRYGTLHGLEAGQSSGLWI